MPKFAEILFTKPIGPDKQVLTYEIPDEIKSNSGDIVDVPLRNRIVRGLIYKIHDTKPPYNTRYIIKKTENAPHLKSWQMDLMRWISEYYFCPLNKVLRLFLPGQFIKKKKIKEFVPPDIPNEYELKFRHELNDQQKKVIERINNSPKSVSLLFGITGSGKTEIYMHIVEQILKQGKQVLILIPEISLTPQTSQRFQDFFHENTVAVHSQLTPAEKEKAWMSIYNNETKIIIGSRSALFAPFHDLGYIIMDEEHDTSYKQDQSPRYHAFNVAKKMASLLGIKLLAGSATPLIETYYEATNGEYDLVQLSERPNPNNKGLPTSVIVDLREELKAGNFSIFSEALQSQIKEKLENKEQIILFLNRRGAASSVICRECGYIASCPECDIPMTYHKKFSIEGGIYDAERLICHHCGFIQKVPVTCPNCDSAYIKYIGIGTQRVEEDIQKLYPAAKIIRADRDTTQKKSDFEKIYKDFKSHKADVLIGTQMISLGLHLPKVNLVGIMLADMGLTIPNFRSAERTFELITQVGGRAGREDQQGHIVIQTYMPDHYAIKLASNHDYKGFYENEIAIRHEHKQPPFAKLIKITIKDKNEKKCTNLAEKLHDQLKKMDMENAHDVNYYPALIPKLKNMYRWNILISGPNPADLLKKLPTLDGLIIDVDPISTV